MEKPTCETCPYFYFRGEEFGGMCCRFIPLGEAKTNIPFVLKEYHCPEHPLWDRFMKWWRKQSKKKNPCK
jgi:hypothetical protein